MIRVSLLTALMVALQVSGLVAQWRVNRANDPMTDANTSTASVPSTDRDAVLAVRCNGEAAFDILVGFDEYFGEDSDDVGFRYRLDEEPVSRWIWAGPSTRGTVLFIREGELWALLTDLRRGSTITVEGEDYDGTSHLEKFSLRGSTRAIDALGCVRPPESYWILFEEPDEDAIYVSRSPRELLEIGCDDAGPYLDTPHRHAEVRLTADSTTAVIPAMGKLGGDGAEGVIEHLLSGEVLTLDWPDLFDKPRQSSLALSEKIAGDLRDVLEACSASRSATVP